MSDTSQAGIYIVNSENNAFLRQLLVVAPKGKGQWPQQLSVLIWHFNFRIIGACF